MGDEHKVAGMNIYSIVSAADCIFLSAKLQKKTHLKKIYKNN